MGRKKLGHELMVYLSGKKIGRLIKRPTGAIEFSYDDEWVSNGFPISLSLPLAEKSFKGEKASFYFDNLLPDNKRILEAIAQKFGAESTKQFDILNAIGKDCVGALSFFESEQTPEFSAKMKIKLLDEAKIAHKIKGLDFDSPLGMEEGDFRISLAGAQEKMALLFWKGHWYEPQGQTPTSHIFKKKTGILAGGLDFSESVENEFTCLGLASQFGIKTCKATIESFQDERVLCVERFDRVWKDNVLHRIPQEDICQSLGVSPLLKYERDGGPGLRMVMKLLESSNNAEADRKTLFRLALFNDLIHNTDGHMKNVSVYVLKQGFALTPMYDLMSAHIIKRQNLERYRTLRSSLSVNAKYHYRDITLKDWEEEAKLCSLSSKTFEEICHEFTKSKSALEKNEITEGIQERARELGI